MARFSRHCEKNYIVIRRSNPVKNCVNQNFFYYFSGLPRRFAPRNDGFDIYATMPCGNDINEPCNNTGLTIGQH
ncbi:hypothetical protein [Rickettsia felis]|uniref:hypothetical protein n=1 Tax=Rickettsia felis TaxID=42862 RepID=UPI000A5931DE|nr:hypothetical protein [Rickettsia felis]